LGVGGGSVVCLLLLLVVMVVVVVMVMMMMMIGWMLLWRLVVVMLCFLWIYHGLQYLLCLLLLFGWSSSCSISCSMKKKTSRAETKIPDQRYRLSDLHLFATIVAYGPLLRSMEV